MITDKWSCSRLRSKSGWIPIRPIKQPSSLFEIHSLENHFCLWFIVLHYYNQSLTKSVSIGWWTIWNLSTTNFPKQKCLAKKVVKKAAKNFDLRLGWIPMTPCIASCRFVASSNTDVVDLSEPIQIQPLPTISSSFNCWKTTSASLRTMNTKPTRQPARFNWNRIQYFRVRKVKSYIWGHIAY